MKAYLLLGSNVGDRLHHLKTALNLISENISPIINRSAVYETMPWGNEKQPSFLNQGLEISTSLTARQLMRKVLKIEEEMGRVRKEKLGPRIIDIDILLFENEIHDLRFLKIPHPEMHNRRFVLVPLAEIDPALQHPVLKKTIAELLEECPDNLEVKKIAE